MMSVILGADGRLLVSRSYAGETHGLTKFFKRSFQCIGSLLTVESDGMPAERHSRGVEACRYAGLLGVDECAGMVACRLVKSRQPAFPHNFCLLHDVTSLFIVNVHRTTR